MPQFEQKRDSLLIGSVESNEDEKAQRKTSTHSLELKDLMAEYAAAEQRIKETGKLPVTIDNKCLMCMQGNRDTSMVLRLFKTACLSYAPSDITYRDKVMSRQYLLGLRRTLIEKVTHYMAQCGIFTEGSAFPRRYYDDLILEQEMAN